MTTLPDSYTVLAESARPIIQNLVSSFQAQLDAWNFDANGALDTNTETAKEFIDNSRDITTNYLNDVLQKVLMTDSTMQTWFDKLKGFLSSL